MASTNSHSYPQHNNDPQDDPQDGPQNNNHLGNDPQNKDRAIVFDLAQCQDITSTFEQCFTSIYPFQTSILSDLNRLDFKNLQLAGVRTPVSQNIKEKLSYSEQMRRAGVWLAFVLQH